MFPSLTGAKLAIEHLAAMHPAVAPQLADILQDIERYDVDARNCANKFALKAMLFERKFNDLEATLPKQFELTF